MTRALSRGQVEASFQWIYVLLAGGAILALFFFLIRGCAQQGDERVQGLAAQAIASRLQAGAWQPASTSNISVRPLDVSCVGGVITLSSEDVAVPIERTPVFLPPHLNGKLTLITKPLQITEQNSPVIPLGSALYVIDENTYYLLIVDADGIEFPFSSGNVRRVDLTRIADPEALAAEIPSSAQTVIIVTDGGAGLIGNAAVQNLPRGATVLGVSVEDAEVEFFSRTEGMTSLGKGPAEHELLIAGAIASGDPAIYRCARGHLEDRARVLTNLYANRAINISQKAPSCSAQLSSAVAIFGEADKSPEYLAELFRKQRELASLQNALLLKSCPVIA